MARDYAKSFYLSKVWVKCRPAFMRSKNFCCERCGRLATIVHHKKYINELNINNPDITLEWDNLQALCTECHNVVHGCDEVCREDVMFNEHGDLVPRQLDKIK